MVSRYEGSEIASALAADGGQVRYLRRRFPPPVRDLYSGSAPPLALHRVRLTDRLDLLSQTYLGDPTAYWMICDANAAVDPDALTDADAEDTVLVIAMPER